MRPEPEPQKLIPQYTLRWLLGLTAVCAVGFAVLGAGVRGRDWAIGVSIGLAAAIVLFVVYGLVFGLIWLLASWFVRAGHDAYRDEPVRSIGPVVPREVSSPRPVEPSGGSP